MPVEEVDTGEELAGLLDEESEQELGEQELAEPSFTEPVTQSQGGEAPRTTETTASTSSTPADTTATSGSAQAPETTQTSGTTPNPTAYYNQSLGPDQTIANPQSIRRTEAGVAPDAVAAQNVSPAGAALPGPGNLSGGPQPKANITTGGSGGYQLTANPANQTGKAGGGAASVAGKAAGEKSGTTASLAGSAAASSSSLSSNPLAHATTGGNAKSQVKDMAVDAGAKAVGAATGTGVAGEIATKWAVKHRRDILIIAISSVLFIIILVVVLIISLSSIAFGDTPTAVGVNGTANVETVASLDGLVLPFPDTKLGHESHMADKMITGTHYAGVDSGKIYPTTDTKNRGQGASFGKMTPEQERWLFNEPWAYDKNLDGCHGGYSHAWGKKKLLVTSVETHKSVVVSIDDCGPNSYVVRRNGIGAGATTEVFYALGLTNPGKGYDKQDGINADRTPKDNDNRVTVAIVKDQNTPLGPVALTGPPSTGSTGLVTSIPADKGICTFCTQKPLTAATETNPNINHNYAMPKVIALHYLSTYGDHSTDPDETVQQAWDQFNNSMKVSGDGQKYVQFVVGKDGTIYQFLPETKQTAGVSHYNVANGGVTISVENEGDFENGRAGHNFTSAQVASNTKLVKYLQQKYGIPSGDVISHMIADCRVIQTGAEQKFHRTDPGIPFMHAVLGPLGINNAGEEQTCATLKSKVGTTGKW
ncbi:MAG: peptidoglycan recognition family protein [bacterium]